MINLMIRNWRLYIRDRAAVLYSLLSVFILIALYMLFLGDNMVHWVGNMPGARFIVDSWIISGLIGVTSFSTTLGGLGTISDDRDLHIAKDFMSSPLARWQISGAYLASSVMVGCFMCLVVLALGEGYIVLKGGTPLSPTLLLQLLGIIVLSVSASASLLFPLVFTTRSRQAFGGISTVAGTLIGFLTGMYIPIGEVPGAVALLMKCFPITHAMALIRQTMLRVPIADAVGAAPPEITSEIQTYLGVTIRFGDVTMGTWGHVGVLVATVALFFGISVLVIARGGRKGGG